MTDLFPFQVPFASNEEIEDFFEPDDDLKHRKDGLRELLTAHLDGVTKINKYTRKLLLRLFTRHYLAVTSLGGKHK